MSDTAIHLFNEQGICKICGNDVPEWDCTPVCEHDRLPPCTECDDEHYGELNNDLCEWCGYDLTTLIESELCCLKQGLSPHDRPKGDN